MVRNRVKRRLRHLVAGHLDDASPVAVVVRALPASAQQPDRLADDLAGAWSLARRRLGSGVTP